MVLWVNGSNNVIIGAPASFKINDSNSKMAYEKQLKVYTGKLVQAVEARKKKKKMK